jgi:hypothetical protein
MPAPTLLPMELPTHLTDEPTLGASAAATADLDALVAEVEAQYPIAALPTGGSDDAESEAAIDRLILAGLVEP